MTRPSRTAFPEIGQPIEDQAIVEGSKIGGGLQTHFLIDYSDRHLRERILVPARSIGAGNEEHWKTIHDLQTLVRKNLPRDGAREGKGHKNYNLFIKAVNSRHYVGLGHYLRMGVGACRENALLTVIALRAAGLAARFAYFKVFNALGQPDKYDHALALIELEGTTYVLDSYRPLGRYYNGHRLVDLLNPPSDGRYPLAGPVAAQNASGPGRWSLRVNPFPLVRRISLAERQS